MSDLLLAHLLQQLNAQPGRDRVFELIALTCFERLASIDPVFVEATTTRVENLHELMRQGGADSATLGGVQQARGEIADAIQRAVAGYPAVLH